MNRCKPSLRAWFAIGAIALLAACTSTPQASPQADAMSKEFLSHPNAATIYVYRSEFNLYDFDSVLYLNGRLMGGTLPGTFFRIDTVPGRNVVHGSGIDVGQIAIDARAGEIYFVSLEVVAGHSNFRLVADEFGRDSVRACCVLLENWSPGQRPLFR